jgi:hypothetical protein
MIGTRWRDETLERSAFNPADLFDKMVELYPPLLLELEEVIQALDQGVETILVKTAPDGKGPLADTQEAIEYGEILAAETGEAEITDRWYRYYRRRTECMNALLEFLKKPASDRTWPLKLPHLVISAILRVIRHNALWIAWVLKLPHPITLYLNWLDQRPATWRHTELAYYLKMKRDWEAANPPLAAAPAVGTWNSDPTVVDSGLDVFFVNDTISGFEVDGTENQEENTDNQEESTESQEEITNIRQELQLSPMLVAQIASIYKSPIVRAQHRRWDSGTAVRVASLETCFLRNRRPPSISLLSSMKPEDASP